ncbi:MAG: hypothetical protein M1358_23230 [Chloroflexi bacterium]|nr:hypothetical protein [Chloroflexota bacterium]
MEDNWTDIPEGPAYIIKPIASWTRPTDDVFQLFQVVEYASALSADNATTILEELVHYAAHLDLATNPIHSDLVGTVLGHELFERGVDSFKTPKRDSSLLVIDLVRRSIHVHRNAIWPTPYLIEALERLGFDASLTQGQWRRAPYQNLWRTGKLLGVFPRNPLAVVEREQEPIEPYWTNPRYCRDVVIPYPIWPPKRATPELLRKIAKWTPQSETASRYELALGKLSPTSDAHRLGQYLCSHEVGELADWFEAFAPLCYSDEDDRKNVLSTVLELESQSPDGETLAGALVKLAAKMRRLDYPMPREERHESH